MNLKQKKFAVSVAFIAYGGVILLLSTFMGLSEAFTMVTTAIIATLIVMGGLGLALHCFLEMWEKYDELGEEK